MAPIRILLADDHNLFRQGLRQICEMMGGFEVVGEAADGQDVVRLAKEQHPDIILVDINMPHMNGIQATAQIIADNPKARVIVLTMYRQDQYVFEAIKAGAKGYLLKNMDAKELVEAIQQVHRGEALIDPQVTDKVMDEFRRLSLANGTARELEPLTMAEMDVLRLVAQGKDNYMIAQQLNLSEQTIANRLRIIYHKLQVNNRTQAALFALRRGWVNLNPDE